MIFDKLGDVQRCVDLWCVVNRKSRQSTNSFLFIQSAFCSTSGGDLNIVILWVMVLGIVVLQEWHYPIQQHNETRLVTLIYNWRQAFQVYVHPTNNHRSQTEPTQWRGFSISALPHSELWGTIDDQEQMLSGGAVRSSTKIIYRWRNGRLW